MPQKEQKRKILARIKTHGNHQFSNRQYRKQLRRAKKVFKNDEYIESQMHAFKRTPVGGEYIMPVAQAEEFLKEIYGDEPSRLGVRDDEAPEPSEEDYWEPGFNNGYSRSTSFRKDDLEGLQYLRKKVRPGAYGSAPPPKSSRLELGNMPGVNKYIGALPKYVTASAPGLLSAVGGSADSHQEIWMSGASVAREYEAQGVLDDR